MRTVFETGKPHFVNHPMMVGDHGERYAAVSCYNSLKIGGGAHTLVRLNLKEVALRHTGGVDGVPRRHPAALRRADRRAGRGPHPLARRAAALLRHALAGDRGPDRPRPVLGHVRHLRPGRVRQPADGLRGARPGRRGPVRPRRRGRRPGRADRRAGRRAGRGPPDALLRGRRRPLLPAQPGRHRPRRRRHRRHPHPGRRRAADARAPHDLRARTTTCSPRASATSSTSTRRRCATRRPWSTSSAARSPAACATSPSTSTATSSCASPATWCARATSPRSPTHGAARHGSDHLAAGSEDAYHLTQRAVKRVGCHELSTRGRRVRRRAGSGRRHDPVQQRRRPGQPVRRVPAGLQLRLRGLPQPADDPRPRARPDDHGPQRRSVDELLAGIRRAAPFLSGVTVSGGEATQQPAFVARAVRGGEGRPRRWRRLTCFVDSNGATDLATWDDLAPVMDGAMIDLKCLDPDDPPPDDGPAERRGAGQHPPPPRSSAGSTRCACCSWPA